MCPGPKAAATGGEGGEGTGDGDAPPQPVKRVIGASERLYPGPSKAASDRAAAAVAAAPTSPSNDGAAQAGAATDGEGMEDRGSVCGRSLCFVALSLPPPFLATPHTHVHMRLMVVVQRVVLLPVLL